MNENFTAFDAPHVPLRGNLFQHDPPGLLGSRCPACGTSMFPAREFCPNCRGEDQPQPVVLKPHGHVHAFTVIHQAPAGRATPYVLALVDLVDQVRVMAQIDAPPDEVALGQSVSLAFRQVATREGMPVVGYVFVSDKNMEVVS